MSTLVQAFVSLQAPVVCLAQEGEAESPLPLRGEVILIVCFQTDNQENEQRISVLDSLAARTHRIRPNPLREASKISPPPLAHN